MTGPEHYIEAEHLASTLPGCECSHSSCRHEELQIARAQVHATLALAAAHVAGLFLLPDARAAWDHATGRADGPEVTR